MRQDHLTKDLEMQEIELKDNPLDDLFQVEEPERTFKKRHISIVLWCVYVAVVMVMNFVLLSPRHECSFDFFLSRLLYKIIWVLISIAQMFSIYLIVRNVEYYLRYFSPIHISGTIIGVIYVSLSYALTTLSLNGKDCQSLNGIRNFQVVSYILIGCLELMMNFLIPLGFTLVRKANKHRNT